MISGVILKTLITHDDERGFFREIFRFPEEFDGISVGQLSHSLVNEGVVKAWHGHKEQSQWNYVVSGVLKVVLYDNRSNSPTFMKSIELLVGDGQDVLGYFFSPGILHGYQCIKGPMQIIYITSGVYDLDDEVRIAVNESMPW